MKLQNLCTRLGQEESFSQRLPLNIEEAKDRLRVLMLRKHPRYRRSDVVSVGDLLTPENAMPVFKRHCFPDVLLSNFKKEVATTWSKLLILHLIASYMPL